ncbi:MAG: hypothetical protein JWM95_2775 [Gemmatimonadetes bacterium]|nr:hypothetical protein [Gemmatimonadota bacterium]
MYRALVRLLTAMTGIHMRLSGYLALVAMVSLPPGRARAQAVDFSAFPPVTVAGSHLRTMKSASTGREYDIQILLPGDYARGSARYPVLYVMDGQWDFKLLASIQGGLFYDKYVPAMIIVGVTYPGAHPDYDALRAWDLSPASSGSSQVGGPRFLEFIEKELIPFIGTNYRADPAQRVLLGNSLGGLFTIYSMLSKPGLFTGFIASSPAVTSANRHLFTVENEYAKTNKRINARLFVGVGGAEPLAAPVKEFVAAVQARGYQGLEMEFRVIDPERHSGNKPETYNRGLRYIFGGKP